MSQRFAVVDDSSSEIEYAGPWGSLDIGTNSGNKTSGASGVFSGFAFNNTLHGTIGNATFLYKFTGLSGTVFGSSSLIDSGIPFDDHNPFWNCSISSGGMAVSKPVLGPQYNLPLCRWSAALPGPHTLTLSFAGGDVNPLWFDYILFEMPPEPGNDDMTIDSRDKAISYDRAWNTTRSTSGEIVMTAKEVGGTAYVTFEGTSVTWFGQRLSRNGKSAKAFKPITATYSIDGGTPIVFQANSMTGDLQFFTSDKYPLGSHNLSVTILPPHASDNRTTEPLTLDRLVIHDAKRITFHATNISSTLSRRRPTTVAIVLVVLSVVVILLIVGALYLRYRRRKRVVEMEMTRPFYSSTLSNHSGSSAPPAPVGWDRKFVAWWPSRPPPVIHRNTEPSSPNATPSPSHNVGVVNRPARVITSQGSVDQPPSYSPV